MRALKYLTIGMGVLIILGTAVLVATVLKRSNGTGAAPVVASAPLVAAVVLDEPAGTRIVGIAAVQDRLAVQLQGGGVDRVLLLDPRTGAVGGRILLSR